MVTWAGLFISASTSFASFSTLRKYFSSLGLTVMEMIFVSLSAIFLPAARPAMVPPVPVAWKM